MSYSSNLDQLRRQAHAETPRECDIFLAGFQDGMVPENSVAVGELAEGCRRALTTLTDADRAYIQRALARVNELPTRADVHAFSQPTAD
jgi:hypothetical protein